MKISIGTNIKDGPWGGGNLFAINLKKYLIDKNHSVIHHLLDDDIDVILMTEPRKTSESSAFTDKDIKKYIKYTNPESLVVHRINECDERKQTNYVNQLLIKANKVAHYTVFVSKWLQILYLNQGLGKENSIVIKAGADKKIFNPSNKSSYLANNKIKIVTHHWGGNWNKGFEVYDKLDKLLISEKWKDKIEFTYIGNLPKNYKFKNTNYVTPRSGYELAEILKRNDIYVTGSLNEPSGNHHIEAAQCGLPLLYIDSGGIPEYCEGYGVKFHADNFEEKLEEIILDYPIYIEKIKKYNMNSDVMSADFLEVFLKMYKNKEIYTSKNDLTQNKIERIIYNLKRKFAKRNQINEI